MKQWLQKIFVSLAIILVCGHNVFPHHHHDEDLAVEQHHDHDDHDHGDGFFSSGHVDNIFVPSNRHFDFYCDAGLVIFTVPTIGLNFELSYISKKTEYSLNKEFPPPVSHLNTSLLRGPPVA